MNLAHHCATDDGKENHKINNLGVTFSAVVNISEQCWIGAVEDTKFLR